MRQHMPSDINYEVYNGLSKLDDIEDCIIDLIDDGLII